MTEYYDFDRKILELIDKKTRVGILVSTGKGSVGVIVGFSWSVPGPAIWVLHEDGETAMIFVRHIISINIGKEDSEEVSSPEA